MNDDIEWLIQRVTFRLKNRIHELEKLMVRQGDRIKAQEDHIKYLSDQLSDALTTCSKQFKTYEKLDVCPIGDYRQEISYDKKITSLSVYLHGINKYRQMVFKLTHFPSGLNISFIENTGLYGEDEIVLAGLSLERMIKQMLCALSARRRNKEEVKND